MKGDERSAETPLRFIQMAAKPRRKEADRSVRAPFMPLASAIRIYA